MLVCSSSGGLERLSEANVTIDMSRLGNGYHDCCVKGGEVKCVGGHFCLTPQMRPCTRIPVPRLVGSKHEVHKGSRPPSRRATTTIAGAPFASIPLSLLHLPSCSRRKRRFRVRVAPCAATVDASATRTVMISHAESVVNLGKMAHRKSLLDQIQRRTEALM